jgi:hypothetical protein
MGTIHEYGGGSITMHPNGNLIFTNHPTNGVYLLAPKSGNVQTIVEPEPHVRFGDFNVHPTTDGWILAIQEVHSEDPVTNRIVAIEASTGKVSSVAEGADFYQYPQFSPNGKKICWIQWNHPGMPWTGSVLHVAEWEPRQLLKGNVISGEAGVESICQPRGSPDGTLLSLDVVEIQKNALARLSSKAFVVIGSTPTVPQALYRVDVSNGVSINLLRATVELPISSTLLSEV